MNKKTFPTLTKYLSISMLGLILLAACGGAGSQTLLGIDAIPNGFDGPEILSVSSDSVSIRFDTGVPTVCNAPFGVTEEFGQVATIPMFSGATLDHVLTFIDLEPDTTYFYKIIATDNDGTVYKSEEVFTFSTAALEGSAAANRTNWLALESGAEVIDVSSNFSGQRNDQPWGANSALDGKSSSEWSSSGDGDDAFIVVALAEPIHITLLSVHTRAMSNDTAQIFSFTVTTDSGEVLGPFELEDAAQPYEFPVDVVASSLRFDAESTNTGNTGFVDLAAYGTPVSEE